MLEDMITTPEGAALITIKKNGGTVATTSDGSAVDMAHQLGEALGLYLAHNKIKYNRAQLWLFFELGLANGLKEASYEENQDK